MSDGAAFASAGSDRAIVAMPEAIDITNSAQISEQLNLALLRGVALVVADFTPTSFCDSSGVRKLALARKRAAGMHVDPAGSGPVCGRSAGLRTGRAGWIAAGVCESGCCP